MMRQRIRANGFWCVLLATVGAVASVDWSARAGALATVETAGALEPAVARVAELPRMRSILVSVDGTLLAEQYFNGAAPHRAANLKSASKSITRLRVWRRRTRLMTKGRG